MEQELTVLERDLPEAAEPEPIQLKKLGQKHKQVLSLLAQGEGRQVIAEVCGITPEYVTWLAKQHVCQQYLRDMQEYVDARLVAMSEQSADVIADTMKNGGAEEKLKAARLQLEVTGKLGRAQSININAQGSLVQILAGIPPESKRLQLGKAE